MSRTISDKKYPELVTHTWKHVETGRLVRSQGCSLYKAKQALKNYHEHFPQTPGKYELQGHDGQVIPSITLYEKE